MASALQHPCFFLSQSATFLPVFEQHASPLEHFFDVDSFTLSLEQLDFFPEQQDLASALLSALASLLQHFFALSSEHFFTVCSIFTFSVFSVVVENDKIAVLFRQIAGALARRIVMYSKENDIASKGEDFGFIKFGSRVDLFFPIGTKIEVELNQVVKGNKTIIASY